MTTSSIDLEWKRFTLQERISRFTVYLVIVVSLVWSWQSVEVIEEFLYDAPEQLLDMFQRMTPRLRVLSEFNT